MMWIYAQWIVPEGSTAHKLSSNQVNEVLFDLIGWLAAIQVIML